MTVRRLPCLLCDQTYLNADAVIAHCHRDHSPAFDSVSAVYGTTCPKCAKTYERLAQHSSRMHHQQIALLFADVQQAGDPHGVVRARVQHLLDQWIGEIEQAVHVLTTNVSDPESRSHHE